MESGGEGVGSCAQERGGPGPEVASPEEGTGVPQLMWAQPSGFWPGHTHVGFSVDSVRQMGVSAPGATSRVSWAQGGVRARSQVQKEGSRLSTWLSSDVQRGCFLS